MFNLKNKNIMHYTFNTLFDEILNDKPTLFRDVYHNRGNYSINTTEDGRGTYGKCCWTQSKGC